MKRVFFVALTALLFAGSANADVLPPASQRFAKNTDETPSFQRHVLPLMGRLGCNGRACHGSFQGQGGFRLSLFGYDFKTDYDALLKGEHPRVDLKKIDESMILDKPSTDEKDYHGGGKRMERNSWQYKLIRRWIEAGAPPTDQDKDPHFVRLEVTPLETVFKKMGEKTQMRVLSHWSDGQVEDVTPLCRFQSNDEAVAKVDLGGQITVTGKGDTHIVAFYDNGVVPVSVILPVTDKVGPKYPSVPTPTKIDELVVAKLRKLGVVPSDVNSDAEFLRRVSLDITGQLPSAEEVQQFVADKSSDKRTKKVNELLDRPAYAAWWATKLCDILGNSEGQLRSNDGVPNNISEQWYRWMDARIGENTHYDDLVAGVVLAVSRKSADQGLVDYCKEELQYLQGKSDATERDTMPYYWARRNMRKANEKALSFSYAFLGVRLQCAECHKHPFDQWSQQDFNQFTAFFNRVNYGPSPKDRDALSKLREDIGLNNKSTNTADRRKLVAEAIKAGKTVPLDELYITPASRSSTTRKTGDKVNASRVITPKVLGGEEVVENAIEDPREPLMQWLRQKDNPYFARAFVNRVWAHYFNVGIVEPADDMNLANAPSNKDLLDWLADSFIEHDFDMKWLHRTIVGSATYQRSWHTNATNELDLRNFSHAVPRRLPAEVVYDAVIAATGGNKELAARAEDPVKLCNVGLGAGYTQRGGGNNSSYALTVFGKPKRETPCDCERSNEPSLLQTVYLRNDSEMFRLIERKDGWLYDATKRLAGEPEKTLKDKKKASESIVKITPTDAVREAYLRAFSRLPNAQEQANAEKYLSESDDMSGGLRDLMWALLNSKEFLVNH